MQLCLDLPQNLPEAVVSAQEHYDQGNVTAAMTSVTDAYATQPSFVLNQALVSLLLVQGQAREAVSYSDDFMDDYARTTVGFCQLVRVNLASHAFIKARQLIALRPGESCQSALASCQAAESAYRRDSATELAARQRTFRYLNAQPPANQALSYDQGRQLPLDEFVTSAKTVLVDSLTTPVIRAALLADLAKLGYDEPVCYYWCDGQHYATVPKTLVAAERDPAYQAACAAVSQNVGADDPVAEHVLQMELAYQSHLFYPRCGAVIVDAVCWVDLLLADYRDQPAHPQADESVQAAIYRQYRPLFAQ